MASRLRGGVMNESRSPEPLDPGGGGGKPGAVLETAKEVGRDGE